MKQKAMVNGSPMIRGVLIGVGISFGLMALLGAVAAWLLNGDKVDLSSAQWLAITAQAIGTFVGVWIALTVCRERMAIVTALTVAGEAVLLLCISMLVFAAGFDNVLGGLGAIAVGGLAACLIKLRAGAGKVKRRKTPFR